MWNLDKIVYQEQDIVIYRRNKNFITVSYKNYYKITINDYNLNIFHNNEFIVGYKITPIYCSEIIHKDTFNNILTLIKKTAFLQLDVDILKKLVVSMNKVHESKKNFFFCKILINESPAKPLTIFNNIPYSSFIISFLSGPDNSESFSKGFNFHLFRNKIIPENLDDRLLFSDLGVHSSFNDILNNMRVRNVNLFKYENDYIFYNFHYSNFLIYKEEDSHLYKLMNYDVKKKKFEEKLIDFDTLKSSVIENIYKLMNLKGVRERFIVTSQLYQLGIELESEINPELLAFYDSIEVQSTLKMINI